VNAVLFTLLNVIIAIAWLPIGYAFLFYPREMAVTTPATSTVIARDGMRLCLNKWFRYPRVYLNPHEV
jgi:hypothetical protein